MPEFSTATRWAVILLAAAGTYALRGSFVALFGRLDEVPPRVESALRYVPAAVLAALVTPAVLVVDGSLAVSPGNDRLVAGAAAAVVGWRTESMVAVIAVGMGVLWTVRFLL